MKIEKVNENQIRCTLTKEDLAERQLKISELAYGTEKAKILFRDMMQQAAYEFGFEADDIPLMIEAIPLSADTIILLITKVECPEEFENRFSRYGESDYSDYYGASDEAAPQAVGADDILDLFKRMQKENGVVENESGQENNFGSSEDGKNTDTKHPVSVLVDITKLFVFNELEEISNSARILKGFYMGENDLYKDDDKYYLLASKSSHSPEDFNKVCNILSEYAMQQSYTPAVGAFMNEHFKLILQGNALQTMAEF